MPVKHPLEGDFSAPMKAAWRRFLANKYGDDSVLRDAWGRMDVSLETVKLPSRIEVRSPLPWVRDYFECYNRLNAQQAVAWCEALKRGASEKEVVLSHGHVFGWPSENLHPHGSGHNAPEILLASKAVTGLSAPASQARNRRNPLPRHACASLRLYGKRLIHSIDLHSLNTISTDDQCAEIRLAFGFAATQGATVAIGEIRDGKGSMRDAGETFNTLPYDNEKVRHCLEECVTWAIRHAADADRASYAELAVFVNPKGCFGHALETAWFRDIREPFRNEVLSRIGLPFDEYHLSDFPKVCQRYKAWVFLDSGGLEAPSCNEVLAEPQRAFYLPVGGAEGEALPTVEDLRIHAKTNGCHVWTTGKLFAGSGVVCAVSERDETLEISLPPSLGGAKLRQPMKAGEVLVATLNPLTLL